MVCCQILIVGLQPKLLFPSYFTLALPLGFLALLGLLIGLYKRKRIWFFLLAYAIAIFLMVAILAISSALLPVLVAFIVCLRWLGNY